MSMVSIVMTTYNGEKYVSEQLESILTSSYQNFDIFIFDDGSQDNTVTILREYEKKYPDRIYLHQNEDNLGVTRNFLEAICHTTSDYVMLCDQDDVWKHNKIMATLKRMRQMEVTLGKATPIAVFTDATIVDQNLNLIHDSFFGASHLNPKKTDLSHLLMENKLIGCTVMLNASLRKILKNNHLPKQAKFHDWWIGLIAAAFGRISYVNQATLLYRQHGNNVVGNIRYRSYVKDRLASLKTQKESLIFLQQQAEEFCNIYRELLSEEERAIIERFAMLHKMHFLKRKYVVCRNGYHKTGVIRNIGLVLIV